MLTPEEQLMIGLKALQRLKPHLHLDRRSRLAQAAETTSDKHLQDAPDFAQNGPQEETTASLTEPNWTGSAIPNTLKGLLDQIGPLPSQTLVLGICNDGLPFILDLNNPAPGALLITGDPQSGKVRLLKAVLNSAYQINSPGQVSFYILAQDPNQYTSLAQTAHCQGVLELESPEVADRLQALSELLDQRRHGAVRGPAILVVIDDLASFMQTLDEEIARLFFTLVKHGPRSRIWTIGTLSSLDAVWVDERILDTFRTRLIGKIEDSELATFLASGPDSGTESLVSGEEFSVLFGEEWLRFSILEDRE